MTITPRPVTLVSGGAEKIYDGTPLRVDSVRVKAGSPGFVAGEGFTAICSGAQTDVGAMENLFDYTLTDGTHADNYEVKKEYGWLRVTPATLDPGAVFGGGETDAEGDPVCARVYNGAPQPFALAPNFGEPYRLYYALVPGDESAYSETAPTRTHVAEGDLAVYFKFLSSNYAPYYGKGILRITPKELTPELVVAGEEAAWIFDGTEKKPAVTVVDGNPNIATTNDYTVAYSDRTGAGLFPVTVTGRNDYSGTVTKEFAILKRPVAPPVIGALSYNGHVRRPSIPADERWTVVANPGGTDAGAYTNIVLRLTAPADYKWKGQAEDETDWTGVFIIKPGPNGWSRAPGLASWTAGETPSVPDFGMPRNGTVSEVFYRARRGDRDGDDEPPGAGGTVHGPFRRGRDKELRRNLARRGLRDPPGERGDGDKHDARPRALRLAGRLSGCLRRGLRDRGARHGKERRGALGVVCRGTGSVRRREPFPGVHRAREGRHAANHLVARPAHGPAAARLYGIRQAHVGCGGLGAGDGREPRQDAFLQGDGRNRGF